MFTLRRNSERHHVHDNTHDTWSTIYRKIRPDPFSRGFDVLYTLDETRISPGGSIDVLHPKQEVETVTYVYEGVLAQIDSSGRSSVINAGEFHRMTIDYGSRYKNTNASHTDWAHIYQISLHSLRRCEAEFNCDCEQKRFTAAQRRNMLCVIGSPDRRKGSLYIHQDTLIYSSILDPGHHLVYEVHPRSSVWIHIVYGEANLSDMVLTQGDGVGVVMESSVSLTAQESTEILLLDLGLSPVSLGGDELPRAITQSDHEDLGASGGL